MKMDICKCPVLVKDQGYAWAILVMSFFSHFLHLGFCLAIIGNLTLAHQQFFDISLQQSSLISSVYLGFAFIPAPLSSILVKRLGCRSVQIIGGTSLALGIGLSSLSRQAWHAYLLFSVLTAFGMSNCFMASSEILAIYFDKYKHLAFSVAKCGFYAGMVAWPSLSQLLLDNYGYSKAMAIMSAFHIVHIITGALFFEPKTDNISNEVSSIHEVVQELPNEIGKKVDVVETSCENTAYEHEAEEEKPDQDGEPKNLPATELPLEKETGVMKDFLALLSSLQAWTLLGNYLFFTMNTLCYVVLVNDFIVHNTPLTPEQAALGITLLGVGNLIGSIGVASVSTLHFDRTLITYASAMLVGVASITTAFTNVKWMLYGLTITFGVGQGAGTGNALSVAYEFCGPRKAVLLMSMLMCMSGIGGMVGPIVASGIAEVASEQYGIVFAGCSGLLSSFILLPLIVYKRKHPQQDRAFI